MTRVSNFYTENGLPKSKAYIIEISKGINEVD